MHTWKHPAIADLYWLLSSPALMLDEDVPRPEYFKTLGDTYLHLLKSWDKTGHLSYARIPSKRRKRLGQYAEDLLAFFFKECDDFEVLAIGHQIKIEKQTIGELDFVIEELKTGIVRHIELSTKFYLLNDSGKGLMGFLGSNPKDRLGDKWNKIKSHQITLGKRYSDQIPNLKGRELKTEVWLKGRLFYPFGEEIPEVIGLEPNHPKGTWKHEGEWTVNTFEGMQAVHKLAWLSGADPVRKDWIKVPYGGVLFKGKEEDWKFSVYPSWPDPTSW